MAAVGIQQQGQLFVRDKAPILEEGVLVIAEHILRGQMNRYRTALERYARTRSDNDLAQFRSIECDLLTPYYAALTLHSIDLREVCNELRQKAGLPELEEMQ